MEQYKRNQIAQLMRDARDDLRAYSETQCHLCLYTAGTTTARAAFISEGVDDYTRHQMKRIQSYMFAAVRRRTIAHEHPA